MAMGLMASIGTSVSYTESNSTLSSSIIMPLTSTNRWPMGLM